MESDSRTRVVLLGASNLTLAFPLVVERLRAMVAGPLEILAAIGHGRSYGVTSSVLFRELPGIDACGLWPALQASPRAATLAVLCDLGNDVVYGSEVEAIAGWIERGLDRLAALDARTVVVRMPLRVVERISPLRFRVARGLIFPGRTIDLPTLRSRVRALDERVVALARARSAALVDQRDEWYGLDPIHIRRRMRPEAWQSILARLETRSPAPAGDRGLRGEERRTLRRARPERRRWLFREQRCAQPAATLLDGTTISLY